MGLIITLRVRDLVTSRYVRALVSNTRVNVGAIVSPFGSIHTRAQLEFKDAAILRCQAQMADGRAI